MLKLLCWIEFIFNMMAETSVCCLSLILMFATAESFNIDTVRSWSYTSDTNSLFGQKVLQYQYGDEKGVYVSSPLKDIEKRIFDGIYKCKINQRKATLECKLKDPFQGEMQMPGTVPYPIVSLAKNSDNILVCQQMKGHKTRSTAGELNGVCSLLVKGVIHQIYPNLTKLVRSSLVEENINNNNNNYGTEEPLGLRGRYIRDKTVLIADENTNNNNNVDDEEEGTEIAIVLDGSGSIKPHDFQKAKDFISNMMKKFWERCTECDFAVVQYGDEIRTEFDLRESREDSNRTLHKVQQIKQLGNVTKTASALQHVLDNIFNETHGSKTQATKIILVLTDGDIFRDPLNLTTVIHSPKMKDIERYVIGVGEAFNKTSAMNELKLIASEGKKHLIRVDDYSALDGLLLSLQQKIIGIEAKDHSTKAENYCLSKVGLILIGPLVAFLYDDFKPVSQDIGTKGDKLEFDLAETGFSVHVHDKQSLVFGAVGSYDWSGGMIIYLSNQDQHKVEFLSEPKDELHRSDYTYLGYSVTTARGKHSTLYIAGAPRHSNVGRVLVFEEDITTYRLIQKDLKGEQLGSYFGFELCTVDLKSDGTTDFLLVGAPFYHINGEEGKVYIYHLNYEARFTLVQTLEQHHYPFARFGYSIANIGDINLDGYQDIAIGAPLEGHLERSDSFGTVYIYNSNKNGINTNSSQRIRASHFQTKLQYFGQSIDGGLDLTNDGYPDISVGALRSVMVLRSRPVVQLQAVAQFSPDRIPLILTDKKIRAQVCFNITPFKASEINKSYLHYSLDLDVDMIEKRITFENEDSGKGKLFVIDNICAGHILTVLPCIYDCFSSIKIKISYTLSSDLNRDLPAPILDMHNDIHTYAELPYEKDCNNKTSCLPYLNLTMHVSGEELIVGLTKELTMNLIISNSGDDSYMTTVLITHPRNLHFKMIRKPDHPSIQCSDTKTLLPFDSSMKCNIGHPIFKASTAAFSIIWELEEIKISRQQAIINVNVSNINQISSILSGETVLHVKHSFNAVLSVPTSTIYVKLGEEQMPDEDIQYTFNVNTDNLFEADLSLDLQIPVKRKDFKVASVKHIQQSQNLTKCREEIQPCKAGKQGIDLICHVIQCPLTSGKEVITITTQLFLQTFKQLVESTEEIVVTGEIIYNKDLFVNQQHIHQKTHISVKFLQDKDIHVLPVVIGSSIGGILLLLLIVVILFKCGFFKRKYKNCD